MTSDLARAEMIAAALPRDYAQDMVDGKCARNVCIDCQHIFVGRVYRTVCAVCAKKVKP